MPRLFRLQRLVLVALLVGLAGWMPSDNTSRIRPLHWPVGAALNDGVFLMMHVDNDRAEGAMHDYQCNDQYVYDGHRGTDISAYNFRQMDEGIPVLAAADGVVTFVRNDHFDRNYWPPYQGEPNAVILRHADGSNSQYWHLRTQSVMVDVGESVVAGQPIAYIGSSGATPIPHLHFEVWDDATRLATYRDPFEGSCHPRTALWGTTLAYPGHTPLRVLDADIFNKTVLLGNEANNFFGEKALKDRPLRPEVFGLDEERLGVWVQLQGSPNEIYHLRLRRPDGSIFSTRVKPVTTKKGIQWHVFYWDFANAVTTTDVGTWTFEVEHEGEVLLTQPFEVGPTSEYAPRFFPLAGRSFRLDGTEQRDQLRLSGREGPTTFRLENAPPFVSLDDGEIIIAASARAEARNTYFQVIAEDTAGRTDTMRYHMVDLSQPFHDTGTATTTQPSPAPATLGANYPNPFRTTTTIPFSLSEPARVTLQLFDLQGRTVQDVLSAKPYAAGSHRVALQQNGVANGVYLCRLTMTSDTGTGTSISRALVIAR